MSDDVTMADGYWSGLPLSRALEWTRVFFDFPPAFPGPSFMNFAYRGFRRGRPGGFPEWSDAARAGERVAMTPEHYYTLRLTLGVIPPSQYARHPHNFEETNPYGYPVKPLRLDEWGMWVGLVNSGTTPLRATRLVLSGGTELPQGFLINLENGTIATTDDV
ncbi:hypothetical protein ACFFGH_28315 [Lysobacter korlensis]|uniref:Uncharacterized protein n=1 Tax=Lysobacter korlensis TaxID=553636 RepID=A0ABV6RXQ1_9GAMM